MKCLSKLEALPLLLPLLIHVDVHHHHHHQHHDHHHHQLAMSAYTITSAQSANRSDSAKSQSARVRGREVERSLNFTRFPDRLAVHVASQNDTFNAYLTCRYIRLRMQLPPPFCLCPPFGSAPPPFSPCLRLCFAYNSKDASGSESELTPLIVTLRVTHARTRMHTHARTHVANLSAIVSTHKCIRVTFVESLLECVPSVLV